MRLCVEKQQLREVLTRQGRKVQMCRLLVEKKRIIDDGKLLTHLYWCNNVSGFDRGIKMMERSSDCFDPDQKTRFLLYRLHFIFKDDRTQTWRRRS